MSRRTVHSVDPLSRPRLTVVRGEAAADPTPAPERADATDVLSTILIDAFGDRVLFLFHRRIPGQTGDLPVRQSETKLPEYQTFLKKYPAEKVFVDNLNNVKHVRPNIPEYGQVSLAIGQMVQSVLLGKASPADALKSADAAVTSALAGS